MRIGWRASMKPGGRRMSKRSLTGARSLSANKRSSLGRRSGGGRNAVKPPHHVFVADADALQRMKMRMRMRMRIV